MNNGDKGVVFIVANGLFGQEYYQTLARNFKKAAEDDGWLAITNEKVDEAITALLDLHRRNPLRICRLVFLSNQFTLRAREIAEQNPKWLRVILLTGDMPDGELVIVCKSWINYELSLTRLLS